MFIGHFAVGFAGKKYLPKVSLGTLFLSVQFADLLWPTLLLLGLEHVRIAPGITRMTPLDFYDYPISHSLAGILIWGILFAVIYSALKKAPRTGWLLGAGVVSHWLLDLIVHRPDLPLITNSGPMLGFGLWNHPAATIILELLIFSVGFIIYLRSTRALDRKGNIALWALALFLVAVWISNFLGEPPPNQTAIAVVSQAQWLLVLWGWYVDKHRVAIA